MGWQDDPIVAPAPKGRSWRDDPVVQPAPAAEPAPGSPQEMLRDAQRPPDPEADAAKAVSDMLSGSPQGTGARAFMRSSQKVGKGLIANTLGAPVDLTTGALNLGAAGVDSLGQQIDPDFSVGRITNPVMGSDFISDSVASALRAAGVPLEDTSQGSPSQMAFDRIYELAAESLAGGGLFSKMGKMGRIGSSLAEPYARPGPGHLVVDSASGAGMGAAGSAYEQSVPEENQGPVTRFLADMFGAMFGAGGGKIAVATGGGPKAIADRYAIDPVTGETKAQTAKVAGEMQEAATANPKALAATLREDAAEFSEAGMSAPTTGSLTGDPGLLNQEQNVRLGPDKALMVERDRQVNTAAREQIEGLKDDGVDSRAPERFVAAQVDAKRTGAAVNVDRARTDLADTQAGNAQRLSQAEDRFANDLKAGDDLVVQREDAARAAREEQQRLGGQVSARRGDETAASERLAGAVDTAKAADTEKKSGLYREATTLAKGTELDPTPLIEDARAIKAEIGPLATPDNAFGGVMRDIDRLAGKEVTDGAPAEPPTPITAADLIDMRPRLSRAISEANAKLQGPAVERLTRLNESIAGQLDDLAAAGDPGAQKWREAEENFRTDFAPKYREGVGRDLDRAERRNTPVPPSAVAGKFLKPEAGGKEAAEDLNRILAGQSTEGAGKAAARDYVLADLARVVNADGTISPHKLRAWRANREGMFQAMPALRGEVDGLLRDVVNKSEATSAMERDLKAAVAKRRGTEVERRKEIAKINADGKLTEAEKKAHVAAVERRAVEVEREIHNDAATVVLDKRPREAAAEVFSGKDSARRMEAIVERLKEDKSGDALRGWKNAVVEHLEMSLTGTDTSKSADGGYNVIANDVQALFKKNEDALAKVFDPPEMRALKRAQKAMAAQQQKGVSATVGSQTAERVAMNALQGGLLAATGSAIKTGMIMARVKFLRSTLPDGKDIAKRLATRAQLDPALAAHLLDMDVSKMKLPAWNSRLSELLSVQGIARESGEEGESAEAEK